MGFMERRRPRLHWETKGRRRLISANWWNFALMRTAKGLNWGWLKSRLAGSDERNGDVLGRDRPLSNRGRHAQTRWSADVSRRIDHFNRSLLALIGLDKTGIVKLDLVAKHFSVRRDAHADEDAFSVNGFDFARACVFDYQSFNAFAALDGFCLGVVDDRDAGVFLRLFEPIRARAVSVRAVDERDARADAGQEQAVLHGGIAAADDRDFLSRVEAVVTSSRETDAANLEPLFAGNAELSFASAGRNDDAAALQPLPAASRAALAQIDLFDLAARSVIQLQEAKLCGEMIAQLASVLRDQSRIIEDAMEHLQHLPAQFRGLFKQHAAQTQRMTPDQGAHPGRTAANDDYIVIRHLNLNAETERRRERGTRRQGDKGTERWFLLSPCLLVSLSPCPPLRLPVFIIPPLNRPSPAAKALPGSSPCRSRGDERPAAPRAAGGVSICSSS